MREIIQLMVGILSVVSSLVLLFLMATSELNFKDFTFATYFGIFSVIAAIDFFILTRKRDNEETKPGEEKVKS